MNIRVDSRSPAFRGQSFQQSLPALSLAPVSLPNRPKGPEPAEGEPPMGANFDDSASEIGDSEREEFLQLAATGIARAYDEDEVEYSEAASW